MGRSTPLETRLKGLALSKGAAVARVCLFNENRHRNLPVYRVEGGDRVEQERARARDAVAIAARQLDDIRARVAERIGPAEAEIFVAQKMIMQDPTLLRRVSEAIETGKLNAEAAVSQTLDAYEARLQEVDDEYIRERASDFGEARRRILDMLADMRPSLQCNEGRCQRGRNRIIVADELTPSLTVELDADHTLGFATERGGRNSHAAILARAMGIPAVSGLPGIRDRVVCGDEILVNGNTGEVVLRPSEATVREALAGQPNGMHPPTAVAPVPGYRVQANINLAAEVGDALSMQAEGIGLYRTEIELLAAGRLLAEDELAERYAAVCRAMAGQPVTFRMPDIGSDKALPFLGIPREDNPALGWRGARMLLGRPDILRPQARAIVRAARGGQVHVLYPMIVDVQQFVRLKAAFCAAVADLGPANVRHGVMFEVPSACLQARAILGAADFASVGTNDLIQYLFAVDRDNALVAADYDPTQPVLWEVLGAVIRAGQEAGKPVTVCGEIGADPAYVGRLIELGVGSVSVNARSIPAIREAAAGAMASGQARGRRAARRGRRGKGEKKRA